MGKNEILMIVNPRAGKMSFRSSFYSVVKYLCDHDYRVVPYFTKAQGDAALVAKNAAGMYDKIIVCGGDGTLNECISGLAAAGTPMNIGYIPCGSTNDFGATLGISPKPVEAVKQILSDENITLDLGRFNDRFFTYIVAFGAFTAASYNTPQNLKNVLGHFAYVLNAAKQLSDLKPIKMKITTSEYSEEGQYLYGAVSNTTSISGVYSLPDEEVGLNDGKFELFMLRKPQNGAGYVNTLLNIAARNYDDPNILFMHTDHVVFESEEPVPYTLDGEFGKDQMRAEISCVKEAYVINGKLE